MQVRATFIINNKYEVSVIAEERIVSFWEQDSELLMTHICDLVAQQSFDNIPPGTAISTIIIKSKTVVSDGPNAPKRKIHYILKKKKGTGQATTPKWESSSPVTSELASVPEGQSYSTETEISEENLTDIPIKRISASSSEWTDEFTLMLLILVNDCAIKFSDPNVKRIDVWNEVASELCEAGGSFNAFQVESKFSNMKKHYKKLLNCSEGGGIRWKWHAQMEEILSQIPCLMLPGHKLYPGSMSPKSIISEKNISDGESPVKSVGRYSTVKKEISEGETAIKTFNLFNISAESLDEPLTGIKWTDDLTLLLLMLVGDNAEKFNDPKIKKVDIWKEIGAELSHAGGTFTAQQVESKFKNMKKHYRTVREIGRKKGRENISWKWFHYMEDICVPDPEDDVTDTVIDITTQATDRVEGASPPQTPSAESVTSQLSGKRKRSDDRPPQWIIKLELNAERRHIERMKAHRERMEAHRKLQWMLSELMKKTSRS